MRCIHVRQSPPGAALLTALSTGLGELAANVDDADLPPRKETATAAASVELFCLAPRPGPFFYFSTNAAIYAALAPLAPPAKHLEVPHQQSRAAKIRFAQTQ